MIYPMAATLVAGPGHLNEGAVEALHQPCRLMVLSQTACGSQEVEGVNSVLQRMSTIAPCLGMGLASSRLSLSLK